jgi:hypothetical protein
MVTIDSYSSRSAAGGCHPPLACFGERGMVHQSERGRHAPKAAGLFGVTSDCAVGAADVAAIMAGSVRKVPVA